MYYVKNMASSMPFSKDKTQLPEFEFSINIYLTTHHHIAGISGKILQENKFIQLFLIV